MPTKKNPREWRRTLQDDERWRPQWASLLARWRELWELQDEVVRAQGLAESDRLRAELEHWKQYAAELEGTLWSAEQEAIARQPGVKPPSRADRIASFVSFIRHCAELDGKPIEQKEAVRQALRHIEACDPKTGVQRSEAQLASIVEGGLESAYQIYLRGRRQQRLRRKSTNIRPL